MPKKKGQKVITKPVCIQGQLFIDDRGEVGCVNNFDMCQIRRFYTVTNHKAGFIRACRYEVRCCYFVWICRAFRKL